TTQDDVDQAAGITLDDGAVGQVGLHVGNAAAVRHVAHRAGLFVDRRARIFRRGRFLHRGGHGPGRPGGRRRLVARVDDSPDRALPGVGAVARAVGTDGHA